MLLLFRSVKWALGSCYPFGNSYLLEKLGNLHKGTYRFLCLLYMADNADTDRAYNRLLHSL
jgi:hypothetical protein